LLQGAVLDGFPKTIEQAQFLFAGMSACAARVRPDQQRAVPGDADGMADGDDLPEPEPDRSLLPVLVVQLEARLPARSPRPPV
jgi:hypothetical protein